VLEQHLRHQLDPRTALVSRVATVVLVLVFAGWLAWFGVAPPWNTSPGSVGLGEFVGRFVGLLIVVALVFLPLLIAVVGGRKHPS